jgi:hypothetical protein
MIGNINKATVIRINGKWMKRSYFRLDNVTLDNSGLTVQCMYKEAVLIDGHTCINYWPVEATLAVITYPQENIGQYGGSSRNRMEHKIRNIKNIVDANNRQCK